MSKKNIEAAEPKQAVGLSKIRDFAGHKRIFFTISLILLILSVASAFVFGTEIAIEFKGGTIISYSYTGDLDTGAINSKASEVLNTPVTIQTGEAIGSDNLKSLTISFSYEDGGFTAELQGKLSDALAELCPDNEVKVLESNDVSPTSGREFFLKCLVAALFALLVLIIFIALRFKKISGWSAGVCAILALLHDLVIVFGSFVVMGFEINANFMAVILTILGYSVNDTIVIYDRIRENKKLMPSTTTVSELVNASVSQSMRRSVRTSITTVISMIIVSIVAAVQGLDSILSFSVPMIFGMVSGTYSSLCVAPMIWVWFNEKRGKKTLKNLKK